MARSLGLVVPSLKLPVAAQRNGLSREQVDYAACFGDRGEPGLVLALTQRLESEGYLSSSRGWRAGLLRTTEAFDLIILDLMLPRKSGFDVC